MNIVERISNALNINASQIEASIKLIDEGCTIPFIARYRKEVTGNLNDNQLRDLYDKLIYLRSLNERMTTVINSIEEQGKMTDELRLSIDACETLSELEDIYRPFKPKRKTRAVLAKERGLAPLAEYYKTGIKYSDYDQYLKSFINEEKGISSVEDAIQGASDIIAEEISDNPKYRKYIKNIIYKEGYICSKEIAKDEKDTFEKYADYKENIKSIPPHRLLAINRGESLKCLKVSLEYDIEPFQKRIGRDYLSYNDFKDILENTINDSLKRLILPSIENEIRNDLFEKAEDASIIVFKKNLKSLLLYPPLKNKTVLGFDPGFRTGCKYAIVNKNGVPGEVGVVYLTA